MRAESDGPCPQVAVVALHAKSRLLGIAIAAEPLVADGALTCHFTVGLAVPVHMPQREKAGFRLAAAGACWRITAVGAQCIQFHLSSTTLGTLPRLVWILQIPLSCLCAAMVGCFSVPPSSHLADALRVARAIVCLNGLEPLWMSLLPTPCSGLGAALALRGTVRLPAHASRLCFVGEVPCRIESMQESISTHDRIPLRGLRTVAWAW